MVIIELIDFIHTKIGVDKNCDCPLLSPSSEQENVKSEISHLINLLKKSINDKPNYAFSLAFEKIGEFEVAKPSSSYVFDLAISEQFDSVIVGQGSLLKVFHRALKNQLEDINLKCLFEVDYGNDHVFHCMKLIKENNEEFLYITDKQCHALKIKVADLMNRHKTLVWKSQQADTGGSNINVWGLDIINGRVYTIDYGKGIKVFDCSTGIEITHGNSDNSLQDYFSNISKGYGLHFFSEEELLISHTKVIELFEKEQDMWKAVKRSNIPLKNAYSIFYEDVSNLIYMSDSTGHALYVIQKDTLQVVKSKTDFKRPFGMIVDKKNGLLYVCDTTTLSVSIFQ